MKTGSSIREKAGRKPLTLLFREICFLLASSLLFTLSFPNIIAVNGIFPLAFLSLVPLFLALETAGWIRIWIYGFGYGLVTYGLFNYWLVTFHPLAILIVPLIYAVYFTLLLPVLKFTGTLFPRYRFIAYTLVWIGYEYLKTRGFLGYAYGIIGYSQFRFLPLIQTASFSGVWGVSLLVVFPQSLLAQRLSSRFRGTAPEHGHDLKLSTFRTVWIGYAAVFLSVLVYGAIPGRFETSRHWKTALIQQNVDPWRGGVRAYRQSLDVLKRLSSEAVREDPDIVIWSETSFVPAIDWHLRHRTDRESYLLVSELIEYLADQSVPFFDVNDDGRRRRESGGQEVWIDYNAALVWNNGRFEEKIYRKVHLVPFTEHFPYEKTFPGIHALLRKADTHFWEKGEQFSVFQAAGVSFATPICFEDTFGYISREFVRNGAEVIVNLTNDSWSGSIPAEMQHMAMAVFRAVENRRTVVRSTNGGITCYITPQGRIPRILEPFTAGYIVPEVPVYTERTTLYTRYGDWLGIAAACSAGLMLIIGCGLRITCRIRKRIDKSGQV